ncbi:MAG: hypothetical protein RIS70_2681 [Planctomycetota bacterium]|jgi:hypothetical protein
MEATGPEATGWGGRSTGAPPESNDGARCIGAVPLNVPPDALPAGLPVPRAGVGFASTGAADLGGRLLEACGPADCSGRTCVVSPQFWQATANPATTSGSVVFHPQR